MATCTRGHLHPRPRERKGGAQTQQPPRTGKQGTCSVPRPPPGPTAHTPRPRPTACPAAPGRPSARRPGQGREDPSVGRPLSLSPVSPLVMADSRAAVSPNGGGENWHLCAGAAPPRMLGSAPPHPLARPTSVTGFLRQSPSDIGQALGVLILPARPATSPSLRVMPTRLWPVHTHTRLCMLPVTSLSAQACSGPAPGPCRLLAACVTLW